MTKKWKGGDKMHEHKRVWRDGRADFSKREMKDLIFEIPKEDDPLY